MNGAVFDVDSADAEAFEQGFQQAKESGQRMMFEIQQCKSLPELLDLDKKNPP